MKHVAVLGSLNIDLVVQVPRFPGPGETLRGSSFQTFLGGKGGNQAMALARLGAAPVMAGRVGDDDFGRRYLAALNDAGADASLVQTVGGVSTGTALIEVEESGQNHIVIVAGANGTWSADDAAQAVGSLSSGDLLLLQLEIPYQAVWQAIRTAAARGVTVILDPAPAPTQDQPIPPDVLASLGWITPNESEAAAITGVDTSTEAGQRAAAVALIEMGLTQGVVKAGARGAWLATKQEPQPVLIPGFAVTVKDTTAAGDSFNGGLAWALSRGLPPREALRQANAVAALSTTAMGAQTAMPDADTVNALLKRL